MMTDTAVLALKSALGLLFIWLFVFFLWKDYCLDMFREDIFDLRDELFQYAANGNLSFENPAYKMLRRRMNVSLRYAHEYTLARFILATTILSKVHSPETAAWEAALESVPAEAKETLTRFRHTFVYAVLKYITLRSFFLYTLVLLATVLDGFRAFVKHYFFPKFVVGVERLESEAIEEDFRDSNKKHPVAVGAA